MERNNDLMVVMEWQPEGKRQMGCTTKDRMEKDSESGAHTGWCGPAGQKTGANHKAGLVGDYS